MQCNLSDCQTCSEIQPQCNHCSAMSTLAAQQVWRAEKKLKWSKAAISKIVRPPEIRILRYLCGLCNDGTGEKGGKISHKYLLEAGGEISRSCVI